MDTTEQKQVCPDCKAPDPIPKMAQWILVIISLICWAVAFVEFYFAIMPVFFLFFAFIFTFIACIATKGKYYWYYRDPEDPTRIHTHESLVEEDGKYFHVKKIRTADSYTEQRIEIKEPIFRLNYGGWFKKSIIISDHIAGTIAWKIAKNNGPYVFLHNPSTKPHQLSIWLPIESALKITYSFRFTGIEGAIEATKNAKREAQEADKMRNDLAAACAARDFLAISIVKTCEELFESKDKMRSKVGQSARERMESILFTLGRIFPQHALAWRVKKPTVAGANSFFSQLIDLSAKPPAEAPSDKVAQVG